jgi:hypothetical protein
MFVKKGPITTLFAAITILFSAVTFAAGAPRPQSESKVASLEQLNLRGEGTGTSTSVEGVCKERAKLTFLG